MNDNKTKRFSELETGILLQLLVVCLITNNWQPQQVFYLFVALNLKKVFQLVKLSLIQHLQLIKKDDDPKKAF